MLLGSLNWNVSDVRSAKLAKGSGRVKPKPIMAVRNPSGRIRKRQTQAVRRGNSKRIDLNDSNRQVRTRMPGGVGGGATPLSRFRMRVNNESVSLGRVAHSRITTIEENERARNPKVDDF